MKRIHSHGFTILELLIAIVIIGILATLVVFVYSGIKGTVSTTTVQNDLRGLASKLDQYKSNHGSYPTTLADLDNGEPKTSEGQAYTYVTNSVSFCISAGVADSTQGTYRLYRGETTTKGACNSADAALIGRWRFNGDAADSSGFGNSGTVNGATITTGQGGQSNGAYAFDGVNDYITLPQQLPSDLSQFTISVWVKGTGGPAAVDSNGYAIIRSATRNVGTGIYAISAVTGGVYTSWINGASTGGSGIMTNASTWRLLTLAYNGSQQTFYVDGTQTATAALSAITNNTATATSIGGSAIDTTYRPFLGSIDDVRIYNRALTGTEILALFNNNAE